MQFSTVFLTGFAVRICAALSLQAEGSVRERLSLNNDWTFPSGRRTSSVTAGISTVEIITTTASAVPEMPATSDAPKTVAKRAR